MSSETGEIRSRSHPNCWGPVGHVCQKPSGRPCIESGCNEPAGTLWGPMWCPEHDVQRLDRISASLGSLMASLAGHDSDGKRT